jgi:hypothetical protein
VEDTRPGDDHGAHRRDEQEREGHAHDVGSQRAEDMSRRDVADLDLPDHLGHRCRSEKRVVETDIEH